MTASAGFCDTLTEGMLLVDHEGTIVECNRAAGHMLLAELDDLLGANVFEPQWRTVFHDGSPVAEGEHPVMVSLQTGEPSPKVTIGVDLPTARRWLSTEVSPFMMVGSSRGALARFTDVTELEWRERNLQFLLLVNRLLVSVNDESRFFEDLCKALVDNGRSALASISIGGGGSDGAITVPFAAGATDFLYEGIATWSASTKLGRGPTGTAMRTKEIQVVNDLSVDPDYEPWRERAEHFGFRSLAAVPFAWGRRSAVLTLTSTHTNSFDDAAVRGLHLVARDIEFGISHLHSVKDLAAALDGTLAALGQMTESRDPYTASHQSRVGSLGAAIATHLGLDSTMVRLIRQSGDVHDVGKVAVPSEILTRPGQLSPLEFEMVKTHTTIGGEILSKASLPWPIAEVSREHHERLDGSGYPQGLRDGEISLPARIIAVADVVEAMCQHRPYRAALGVDKALDVVMAGAGTLFDSNVVDACLAVFKDGYAF